MTPETKAAEIEGGYQVVMPKLGLTMTEATLVEWLKEEGERVETGEGLFVLETEKSTLEIEAPAAGRLHILVPAGETVAVQTPVARLVSDQGAGISDQEARSPDSPLPDSLIPDSHPRTPASPKARRLARRLDVPLTGIGGTGARGMIVAADVERAAAARPKASPVARRLADHAGVDLSDLTGSGPGGRIMRQDVEGVLAPQPAPPAAEEASPEVRALSGLRAVIAERLSASWRERPHVTLTTEADATNLIGARQQLTEELGHKVAYDALLVALVARALAEQPGMNARLTEGGIEQLPEINVGVAIDTERGLLVPVVRDAGAKGLLQIQRTLAELAERALSGRSLPDDLAGGTFTITNLGMFEIDAFTPIINPPESAILGVGRIVAKPVAVDRQVVVRDVVTLSLSFDHRLIDGGPAARFLQRVKQLVERPFVLALGESADAQG
ncbi:MAG: dihydrolipoamide acetyltransferase family protein [Anaerolineae bacterium]|jgi:pyruvate dehydrogenase E2 component (dihydrolipoamide acetyltransferase)